MPDSTTIRVSHDTWRELHQQKEPGDSMDDVIQRLLAEDSEPRDRTAEVEPWELEADSSDAGDPLDDVSFPRDRDAVREATDAVVAYLEETSGATMREIVNAQLAEHPLGYKVVTVDSGERYRGAWWRKNIKPALKALPNVKYDENSSEWRVVD